VRKPCRLTYTPFRANPARLVWLDLLGLVELRGREYQAGLALCRALQVDLRFELRGREYQAGLALGITVIN
jgi:hypothetical protein